MARWPRLNWVLALAALLQGCSTAGQLFGAERVPNLE